MQIENMNKHQVYLIDPSKI